jgi:hypothetical protein
MGRRYAMNIYHKNDWKHLNYILALIIISQMFTAVSPAASSQYSVVSYAYGRAGAVRNLPLPVNNGGRLYYLAPFTGNEPIVEIEMYQFFGRNSLGYGGFTLRFLNNLLSGIGLGVLILCFGYVINKKEQLKSILATKLGGHAPPLG